MSERYVEVVGTSEYSVNASAYCLGLSIESRSEMTGLKASRRKFMVQYQRVMAEVIKRVGENGIEESDIEFGGLKESQYWASRKTIYGRSINVIFRSPDQGSIASIPAWLSDIETGDLSLEFKSCPPVFDPQPELKVRAAKEALVHARKIADAMAESQNQRVSASQGVRHSSGNPKGNVPHLCSCRCRGRLCG